MGGRSPARIEPAAQKGQIECLAVEADVALSLGQVLGKLCEVGGLFGRGAGKVLAHHVLVAFELAYPGQKDDGAGAASQARGFRIYEDDLPKIEILESGVLAGHGRGSCRQVEHGAQGFMTLLVFQIGEGQIGGDPTDHEVGVGHGRLGPPSP